MINITQRNRAIKELLKKAYPSVKVRVHAGGGTAHYWVYILFDKHLDATNMEIEGKIVGAGIEISYFNADDMGGTSMLPCVTITNPRKVS